MGRLAEQQEEEDDDDEDEYYYDSEDEEDYGCTCGQHHQHGSFHSFFETMFARHYSKYGFNGFFDDDDEDYANARFWRRTANKKSKIG